MENLDKQNAEPATLKELLLGETLLLGLLGKLIYSAPELPELQGLVDEDVFQEVPLGAGRPETGKGQAYLLAWAENCRPQIRQEQFENLQFDHLQLFVGAGKVLAPAWESYYLSEDGLLFQEETLQVRAWYHRYGMQAERQYHEPDDHLGLELTFLALLSRQALEASESGDLPGYNRLRADQRRFFDEHLARWAPYWCDRVEEHARTDFYRGLALLVRGLVAELSENLPVYLS